MASLKNKSPLRTHEGHATEKQIILPEAYIATLAYRRKDDDEISKNLSDLVNFFHGEILSKEIAQHEWENRFKVMLVKRLSPSLVPAE